MKKMIISIISKFNLREIRCHAKEIFNAFKSLVYHLISTIIKLNLDLVYSNFSNCLSDCFIRYHFQITFS